MKRKILFPYIMENDNRKGFAFAVELACRSNADVIALTSLQPGQGRTKNAKRLETVIKERKDQIYCNLLEMKGYYHGRYNQWNAFDEIKIQSGISTENINWAICSEIKQNNDLVIVLQQRYFSGTGLYEELFSCNLQGNASFYVLPREKEFNVPATNLIGVMFNKQKRLAFIGMLNETKIFDLPEDKYRFRQEMIMQQAV
jgi:hypothetical protein